MRTGKRGQKHKDMEVVATIAFAILLIYAFSHKEGLVHLALALLFIALFIHPVSSVIAKLWLSFAEKWGEVMNKLLLGVIFFLFLTPLAFIFRMAKGIRMAEVPEGKDGQWVPVNREYSKSHLENLW